MKATARPIGGRTLRARSAAVVPRAHLASQDAPLSLPRRAAALAAAAAALAPPLARADVAVDAAAAPAVTPTLTITQRAFFDLGYGDGSDAGRIVIGLYGDTAPKTVANFVSFITGDNPAKKKYQGCAIHRVVKGFVLQGGDVIAGNGTGSTSLYGREFPDEPSAMLTTPFNRAGILAMANRGPNTNGSQWFITVAPTPFLGGKYAVFGEVVEGLDTAIALANTLEVDFTSRPKRGLVVKEAGLL